VRSPPEVLRRFLAPYGAEITRLFFAAREAVLAASPKATELIYDAYNAVSCAYSLTDRLDGAFCHVAAYPRYVNLGFNCGAELPDPEGLLAGSGARIRHVRVGGVDVLQQPAVRRLIRAAVVRARASCPTASTKGRAIVKAVADRKRRPER
jgi:hypothetical protein